MGWKKRSEGLYLRKEKGGGYKSINYVCGGKSGRKKFNSELKKGGNSLRSGGGKGSQPYQRKRKLEHEISLNC